MDTKEAIKFLTFVIENVDFINATTNYKDEAMKDIITLLERGEKFEKIVWEINNERLSNEYDEIYGMPGTSPRNVNQKIKDIIQKHFPKPVKKTITIELEATADHIITHHIDLIKADLERRKDCPTIKYKIKEVDSNET